MIGHIKGTGALLFIMLAAALCAFVYGAFGYFGGALSREALSAQGRCFIIGGVAFGVAFSALWLLRKRAIQRHLLDAYGEECCKMLRRPIIPKRKAG